MKHPYATDSSEREMLPLYFAAAAVFSAIGLGWLFKTFNWTPPSWIDAPSTAAFYGVYYQLFRAWVWRWKLFRRLGIVKVPDLNGQWEGYVITTYDEHNGRHAVKVGIQQDWTHMRIVLSTDYSQSQSLIGAILIQEDMTLTYDYSNEPLPGATGTMHAHRGSTRLVLSSDGRSLSGDYYTGRDRTNYGSLTLRKV